MVLGRLCGLKIAMRATFVYQINSKREFTMRRKPLGLFVGLVLGLTVIVTLISCGGGSDSGDLIIDGSLSSVSVAAKQLIETRDGLVGYNISGLGDSDTTDINGKFQIFGDRFNIPAQTLLIIDNPDGTSSNVVLDTSGAAPFIVNLTFNGDGSISGVVIPNDPGSNPTANPTDFFATQAPTSFATSAPTEIPISTATVSSGGDGGFSENADCFCNDGYGPVAPSFTCADTASHPTNCVEPTPSFTSGTPNS